MGARSILTLALATFVVVAVIAIVTQPKTAAPAMPKAPATVAKAPPEPPPVGAGTTSSEPPPVTTTNIARAVSMPGEPKARAHRIVAMYFHGNVGCITCRKVEAYAREAIEAGFRSQVEAGLVEFRAINVEEPENRHFIENFQLDF